MKRATKSTKKLLEQPGAILAGFALFGTIALALAFDLTKDQDCSQ